MRRAWLIGAIVCLLGPAAAWTRYVRTHGVTAPSSPIDAAQPTLAAYWRFLDAAERIVPRKASYTIHASNADEETQLFMVSASLFADRAPFPRTYNWQLQPGGGAEAKYVLVYGTPECPPDAPQMQLVPGGCVCTRDR